MPKTPPEATPKKSSKEPHKASSKATLKASPKEPSTQALGPSSEKPLQTPPRTPVPEPRCGACPVKDPSKRRCRREDGAAPSDCPTIFEQELARELLEKRYKSAAETKIFAVNAAKTEREGYKLCPGGGLAPDVPRIVEIVHFARMMGYRKLGLIFCFGLRSEAAVVNRILEVNSFEVVSVCCKVGNVPKGGLGLTPDDQLDPSGPEPMCNPILQAELVNKAKVDFNIMMGLCVGHDSLAISSVKAPLTVLAVKDRLMGNNPLAPIYVIDSYMGYLKRPLP